MLAHTIQSLDAQATLFFNTMGQPLLDPMVLFLTKAWAWLPLYLLLVALLWQRFGWRHTLLALAGAGLCVLIADQTASGLCKPLFHRLRPTHEPTLEGLIRIVTYEAHGIVREYRGGQFGFFSSHAANTCAIATFISLILRRRWITALLTVYALTNCWTRLYLGVHYVGDVTVGIGFGLLTGWLVLRLYWRKLEQMLQEKEQKAAKTFGHVTEK